MGKLREIDKIEKKPTIHCNCGLFFYFMVIFKGIRSPKDFCCAF